MAYCSVADVQELLPSRILADLSEEIAVYSLACIDGRPIALAGTGNGGKIFQSTDGGNEWTGIGRLGTEEKINSLVQAGSSVVLAGTSPGGKIYRSTDYGASWADKGRLGAEEYVNTLAFLGNAIVLAGTSPSGKIYRSVNDGEDWTDIGQFGTETAVYSLAKSSGGIVLAGTSPNGKVYKSTNYGLNWTDIGQLGTETAVYSLVQAGSSVVLAGTSPGGKIYRSTDYGASWADKGRQGSEVSILCLAYIGDNVAVAGGGGRGHIFYSTDNGVTWYDQGKCGYSKVYSFANLQFNTILIGTGDIAKIFLSTSVLKYPFSSYPLNHFPAYYGPRWNRVGLVGDYTWARAETFIAAADDEINTYCYERYTTQIPFDPVPGIIKWISIRLAAAELWMAVRRADPEATYEYLYAKQLQLRGVAIGKLMEIASGMVDIYGADVDYSIPMFGTVDSESVFDDLSTVVREV